MPNAPRPSQNRRRRDPVTINILPKVAAIRAYIATDLGTNMVRFVFNATVFAQPTPDDFFVNGQVPINLVGQDDEGVVLEYPLDVNEGEKCQCTPGAKWEFGPNATPDTSVLFLSLP
jgi:hypothetical protein